MIFGISGTKRTVRKESLDFASPCWEDERLSIEGKIVPKYCNISKPLGRGSIPPPPPNLYHGGGMNLRVRPRVKVKEDYAVFPSFYAAFFFAIFHV